MMRRDRQSASDGPRMGVIRRAALLRTRPQSARSDWLALVAVGAMAVVVLLFVSGVLGTGQTSAGPTDAPLFTVPGVGLATFSPEATRTPTAPPSPTALPTASPTFLPTASPILTAPPSPIATLSATPGPTGTPPRAGLTILEPVDGAIYSERFVIVRGLAPPGSIVTRDIPLWFDDHTTADATGRWSLAVQLERGENELTFRIGDDLGTARRLIVHLVPG